MIKSQASDSLGQDSQTAAMSGEDSAGDAYSTELSFAQQRLWLLDQMEPGLSVYNSPTALRLEGPLDSAVLERSLNALIERHEVLRTTFSSTEGIPRQVIHPRLWVKIAVLDLRLVPDGERELQVRQRSAAAAEQPFSLEHLVRAQLLRLADDVHLLLMTVHHIVSDAQTMTVLLRELGAVYGAYLRGDPSPLAPLPIRYADYATWQREWLQGEALESQLAYWKTQLGGAEPLELPTDRPRPPKQSYRGALKRFVVSSQLTQGLKALSRKESVTSFMALLAGFKVLLQRYSGQQDISVGTPIAGRNRTELEGLVGFFVNTLVVRTDLSRFGVSENPGAVHSRPSGSCWVASGRPRWGPTRTKTLLSRSSWTSCTPSGA